MNDSQKSPSPSSSQDTTQGTLDGANGDFAFLVHSQESLSHQAAPEIDDQRLVRQKRRRTSPEDHATLEAEYERNPKPDKAARMDIVRRVALGEKEVQIWFQNRRQMARRKSRPLLPHEVIANFYSTQHPNIAPSSSISTNGSSQQPIISSQGSVSSSQTTVASMHPTISADGAACLNSRDAKALSATNAIIGKFDPEKDAKEDSPDPSMATVKLASSSGDVEQPCNQPTSLIRSLSQTLPNKRHPGYFANRRSASFMLHAEPQPRSVPISRARSPGSPKLAQENSNSELSGPSQQLKRNSSFVRLSLSLDGKAEVTTRTGDTPSPPHAKPEPISDAVSRRNAGLQRSYSALEPSSKTDDDSFSVPFPRRTMAGRSRDARTWEFYCDSDARNALTKQAEREESGSATAAIGLIRSCSQNKKIMTSIPNKRNAHTQKPDFTKRFKTEDSRSGKPKLARAISSIARLQSTKEDNQQPKAVRTASQKSKSGSQIAVYEGDGDSDKENWKPGTQTSNPRRRRPVNAKHVARVLEDSLLVPSQSTSLDALMHREGRTTGRSSAESPSNDKKENSDPDVNNEVAAFMGEPVPRQEEDLDCVQHLLSLSQAAWQ